jgi:DNA-binding LacI/PurR family transcriptional regulator
MLLAQLRHEPQKEHSIILPVSLVERESVRNLNK